MTHSGILSPERRPFGVGGLASLTYNVNETPPRGWYRNFKNAPKSQHINCGCGHPVAHQDLTDRSELLVPQGRVDTISQTSRASQPQEDALVVAFQDRHGSYRMPTYHTDLQGLLKAGVVQIVCIWGDKGSKGLFRKRLEAARPWGGLGIRLILKAERVAQANG